RNPRHLPSFPTRRSSDLLASAVQALPPRMRAAVALHYYADLEVDAVAHALSRSRNTVKSELRLALARLRQLISDETPITARRERSEEHTSELQSRVDLVC